MCVYICIYINVYIYIYIYIYTRGMSISKIKAVIKIKREVVVQ